MSEDDDDGAWIELDDMVALHAAGDANELRRRLVLSSPGHTNPADAFEPWCLFRSAHKDCAAGAAVTAVLLVTDRRWRRATWRLIRQIEESGLVADAELDLLAQTFLLAETQVYWEAPEDWFTGPELVIDIELPPGDDDPDSDALTDDPEDGPVVFARDIRPPLRRWAAARRVRAEPASWSAVLSRARELDARSGAAVVRGILDAVDHLQPTARDAVLALAAAWPQRGVREAAAERLDQAARAGDEIASPPTTKRSARTQPSLF